MHLHSELHLINMDYFSLPPFTYLHPFRNANNENKSLKSLHRSRTGSQFYGTEYEICADFGPIGNIEKKWGLIMSNFGEQFFHVSRSKKPFFKFLKNFVASPLKIWIIICFICFTRQLQQSSV